MIMMAATAMVVVVLLPVVQEVLQIVKIVYTTLQTTVLSAVILHGMSTVYLVLN